MRYGQDLLLDVIPFDFGNKNAEDEIIKIVNVFFKPKPYLYIELEQQLNIAAENETKYGK